MCSKDVCVCEADHLLADEGACVRDCGAGRMQGEGEMEGECVNCDGPCPKSKLPTSTLTSQIICETISQFRDELLGIMMLQFYFYLLQTHTNIHETATNLTHDKHLCMILNKVTYVAMVTACDGTTEIKSPKPGMDFVHAENIDTFKGCTVIKGGLKILSSTLYG